MTSRGSFFLQPARVESHPVISPSNPPTHCHHWSNLLRILHFGLQYPRSSNQAFGNLDFKNVRVVFTPFRRLKSTEGSPFLHTVRKPLKKLFRTKNHRNLVQNLDFPNVWFKHSIFHSARGMNTQILSECLTLQWFTLDFDLSPQRGIFDEQIGVGILEVNSELRAPGAVSHENTRLNRHTNDFWYSDYVHTFHIKSENSRQIGKFHEIS